MTIYQITHKQRFHLQEVRNIYYYETTVGDPSPAEFIDIVDEIRVDYAAELAPNFTNQWNFYGIDYRIVDTAGLLSFEALPTAGQLVGASATDSVATQVALLVSVKGTTTKPNRARTYLCGFIEDFLTNSLWTAGAQAFCETFVDLQSVLNGAGTNPLQRVSAQWNSSHTQVIVTNNIAGDASKASQVPATQRRRRIGVGI